MRATCSSIPDPTTAWVDVFNQEPTLSLICTIVDPITREPYDRDPRGVAEKAEAYLNSTGIADTAFFGPEAEFFIFDEVRYSCSGNSSFHLVDSGEGHWNSAREEFPESRLQDSSERRLLPGRAGRHFAGHPQRDVSRVGKGRHPDRAPASRSRDRRAGEIDIRYAPLNNGRLDAILQIHRSQRREEAQQDRDVHAEAALRRQRQRHAYPHVALERRQAALSPETVIPGSAKWRCFSSAGF